MIAWLTANPALLLFLVIALGTALGGLKYKGVGFGAAAVLFVAIGFSAYSSKLAVPESVGMLGLTLFAYCVGITSGPSFFAGFKRNLSKGLVVLCALLATAAVTYVGGHMLGLTRDVAAGVFAGSTTNTPALAAAIEQVPHGHPTVGYSIAYPFGVVIMLAGALIALRLKRGAAADSEAITNLTIVVDRTNLPTIRELQDELGVIFSRMEHEGAMAMAANHLHLSKGDRVVAVGTTAAVHAAAKRLGRASSRLLELERSDIHYRRVTISQKAIIGKSIGELDLWGNFGGAITRVRRMDQDMLASPDLVLQEADRVRVAAPHARMGEIVKYLGDSEHASADINAFGLALGLAIALAIGAIAIPLPMGSKFALGSAGGPLIVGMVLGRIRRSGPIIWTLPAQAADALSHFGLLIFLAYAGGRAGGPFVKAIESPEGAKIALLATIVTTVYAALLYLVCKRLAGVNGPYLAGVMAGAQTQPAVLATANDRTHHDPQVPLGYAVAYPVAMIVKIMVIPFLLL